MTRLPIPGGDNGNWGKILNDYLSVEHNPDGSLKVRSEGLPATIADGSITASKLSPTVNNYLASAQTAVQTVNGKSGQAVTLNASDVSAVATSAVGAAGGIATLDGLSKLTAAQLPSSVVTTTEAGPRQTPWFNSDSGQFEWRNPDLLNVHYFAHLDEEGDQTAMIQAAIDYAEANLDKYRKVFIPSGTYEVSGLTTTFVSLQGEQPARPVAGTFTVATPLGTVLKHKAGSTTPLITLGGGHSSGYGWDVVEQMVLIGRQEQNVAVPKRPIVSASSRTVFTVATEHVPPTPSNSSSFPGFGVCVFYDANGYKLGTGIVQSVNAGTGQITLFTGTDNYTGITGSGNLLTNTETVAFAPRSTYVADGGTQTDVSDSTMISPPAIYVSGRTKRLQDLYIYGFHCGIVMGDSVTQINRVWTNNCGMAGLALRTLGQGADVSGTHWYFQGNSARDIDRPAASIGVIVSSGRMSLCGMWGIASNSYVGDLVTNNCFHGVIDRGGGVNTRFSYALLDIPLKEPWITWEGHWGGGLADPTISFGTFAARANRASVIKPPDMAFPSGSLSVIGIMGGNHRKLKIGTISATRDAGGDPADDFEYLTNIANAATNGKHDIYIDHLADVSAVTNKALHAGSRPYMMGAPFGTSPLVHPVQIASKRALFGSDSPANVGITDGADKSSRLGMFNRTLADAYYCFLGAQAQETANLLTLGGGDAAAQAATRVTLATSSTKTTGAGTDRLIINNVGRVSVGAAAATAHASAALDVQSTTGGLLFPRMTGGERDAITTPTDGLVIYNTTASKLQVRAGGSWVDLH